MSKNKCKCGEELHKIEGWITEPEGIRGNYFCHECMIIWEFHKSGMYKIGIVRNPYAIDLITSIQNKLQFAIHDLEKLKPNKNNE